MFKTKMGFTAKFILLRANHNFSNGDTNLNEYEFGVLTDGYS